MRIQPIVWLVWLAGCAVLVLLWHAAPHFAASDARFGYADFGWGIVALA